MLPHFNERYKIQKTAKHEKRFLLILRLFMEMGRTIKKNENRSHRRGYI